MACLHQLHFPGAIVLLIADVKVFEDTCQAARTSSSWPADTCQLQIYFFWLETDSIKQQQT